jgi:hypothetical protein
MSETLFHRHGHCDIKRWMLFVDGENFTLRAQELAKKSGLQLRPCEYYSPDVFIWFPLLFQGEVLGYRGKGKKVTPYFQSPPLRSYYYTSVVGDDQKVLQVKQCLWDIGFHPEVFKKPKRNYKTKGVDISLTKDVLSHAFHDNYDLVVILAGDGDYIPLINEVKHLGKLVYIAFFSVSNGLNPDLRLASDMFHDIEKDFLKYWQGY